MGLLGRIDDERGALSRSVMMVRPPSITVFCRLPWIMVVRSWGPWACPLGAPLTIVSVIIDDIDPAEAVEKSDATSPIAAASAARFFFIAIPLVSS